MTTYFLQRLTAIGISRSTASEVVSSLSVTSLGAGDPIWPSSLDTFAWRFIIDGIVAVVTRKAGAFEVHNIYGPETWFGEQQIINGDTSYIDYVCATDVEFLSMPASTFLNLLDREPCFAKYLARLTAWRAQRNNEALILMKSGNPCLRTVIGLGMFFEAVASNSDKPVSEDLSESLTIPVKQDILAQLCGVSRSSFWENVSRLYECGWLNVHYGKLELLNLSTWRTVMRRRRECSLAKMDPTIDEMLSEFLYADMARPNPGHMLAKRPVSEV